MWILAADDPFTIKRFDEWWEYAFTPLSETVVSVGNNVANVLAEFIAFRSDVVAFVAFVAYYAGLRIGMQVYADLRHGTPFTLGRKYRD